ncbi:MAG: cysteine--tRNA ligase [Thermosphaera sp.]
MLPEIRVYNTLTRTMEKITPVEPGLVKMYVCGPTVYDSTHVGHGRAYVMYDVFKRYLNIRGYHVFHVMNITDIDDKIINRSKEEGRDWLEIVETYTREYMEALNHLNVKVDHHPRVTQHVSEIIEFIQKLIEKGYAYVAPSGSVYFDVNTYEDYGRLSGRLSKETWSQEPDFLSEKKNPYDFALWKAAKPGEPYWESPWGRGRPGWHIECSVMSSKYLGERFDIHGGGTDLIFPHHENERAQSEAALGSRPWVSIWMHVGMLMVGADKMSKSLKNIVPIKEAVNKWGGKTLRFWYLMSHYRKPVSFSEESLRIASEQLKRLNQASALLQKLGKEAVDPHKASDEDIKILKKLVKIHYDFHTALSEDFNTPEAVASLNEFTTIVFRDIQYNPKYVLVNTALRIISEFDSVLGVLETPFEAVTGEEDVDSYIRILVDVRRELRERRLYDLADMIRSELGKLGVVLSDKGAETTWIRVKKQIAKS